MAELSATGVAALKGPGRYSDGDNLYLVVDRSGAKRWVFMFRWGGRRCEMGLGGVAKVKLAIARAKAREARELLGRGVNPLEVRKADDAAPNFREFCDAYIKAHAPSWKGKKTEPGWRNTLENHAKALGPKRLDEITTADIESVLRPIWTTKAETAQKLQNRLERVLDAAKVKGYRSGDNPARWRGHMEHLLSARLKLTRGHHPAMPYGALPKFMTALRDSEGMGALALRFAVLTAAREGMVIEAVWGEIDLAAAVWTIPAVRMKGDLNDAAGEPFQVPLSTAALEVLTRAASFRLAEPCGPDFVFPSAKVGRPLSNATMDAVLDRMKEPYTPHGFRSTFRDWAGEETDFPCEVVETALAHVVGSPTERAYRRGKSLGKRVTLMEAWGRYATQAERRKTGTLSIAA